MIRPESRDTLIVHAATTHKVSGAVCLVIIKWKEGLALGHSVRTAHLRLQRPIPVLRVRQRHPLPKQILTHRAYKALVRIGHQQKVEVPERQCLQFTCCSRYPVRI